LKELDDYADKLIKDFTEKEGNSGDCALLMTQYDMIISASRAFAERHKSKLRHFAHDAAACDRFGDDYGVIRQGLILQLQEIKRRASSDRPDPV
jgi:hypothetical protein